MLLLLMQSLPYLNFSSHLYSNSKEGLLPLVFPKYLHSLALLLSCDLSTLIFPTNFRFHLNWKEGIMLILLLQSLPPLNFRYFLHLNYK